MANLKVNWFVGFLVTAIVILCVAGFFLVLRKGSSIRNLLQARIRSDSGAFNPANLTPPFKVNPQLAPKAIVGVGVLGDSGSDEYRADDNRGGKYAATTLNWVEQLAKSRGLNFGEWGTWGEPRRTGFEYNWARSGARAQNLIDQAPGLAQQVAQGKVSHVILYIGANDFHIENGTYQEIYDGSLSDSDVQKKVETIIRDITQATNTELAAGPVKMVIVNLADAGKSAAALKKYPDPARRKRVTDAIAATNLGIEQMAQEKGIPVADLDAFSISLLSRLDENYNLHVGDALIQFLTRGNDPYHLQLDDYSGHPSTVCSGLLANAVFVEPFNLYYQTGIAPLSDNEILENAGIKPTIEIPSQ
jgi:lysophospholipase L1-like esterase